MKLIRSQAERSDFIAPARVGVCSKGRQMSQTTATKTIEEMTAAELRVWIEQLERWAVGTYWEYGYTIQNKINEATAVLATKVEAN